MRRQELYEAKEKAGGREHDVGSHGVPRTAEERLRAGVPYSAYSRLFAALALVMDRDIKCLVSYGEGDTAESTESNRCRAQRADVAEYKMRKGLRKEL